MSRFRDSEMVSGKLVNQQDNLIKDLERKLEEAREEIKENRRDHLKDTRELLGQLDEAREFEKRIKHHCQAYENTGNAWFNIYQEVEQLKEKGDE